MAGTLRLSNTGTGNGQSTITTAASGDTTYTLPSGGGTFVTTASTEALTVPFASGTAGSPSVTFIGDTDTGIYSPGANQVAIATSGNANLYVASDGKVGIGTTSPSSNLHIESNNYPTIRLKDSTEGGFALIEVSPGGGMRFRADPGNEGTTAEFIRFDTAASERARIDSSGRLLVGTSTALSSGGQSQYARLQIIANSTSSTGAGFLALARGEAATAITADEDLGMITFSDNAGNTFATIAGTADATAGSGDYPGRLVFSTTADGASSPTERMRINRDGTVTAAQIYNATTANAANVNVSSAGTLTRSTSSIKYKTDVETLQDSYADALLDCRPVWYRSTCNTDSPEHSWWGFIAEEVAAIDPRLVHWKTTEVTYDEKGSAVETPCDPEPEGVAYDRFVPHLLNLIKRQKEQIEAMEARLSALESN